MPIIVILAVAAFGCVTASKQKLIFPKISNFIGSSDFAKYEKIAVLPFMDAPYAPTSGQVIQGLVSQSLGRYGFQVIERTKLNDILQEQHLSLSGAIDSDKSIEIGKILGVEALVVGEVGQYETHQIKTDTVYYPILIGGVPNYIPVRGSEWNESFVSISLRFVDVQTGRLIYGGSGQFDVGVSNPPQETALYVIDSILAAWIISPGVAGFHYEKMAENDKLVITEVIPNSPADKVGLIVGDKIIKIKGKDTSLLSPIAFYSLTWGYPGEILNLEVDRNNNLFQVNIKRASRIEIETLIKHEE